VRLQRIAEISIFTFTDLFWHVGYNTENSGTGTIDERYMRYQISLNNNELWLDYIEKKR